MKWITRERVKVDRVACPWLIKRFIDPDAELLFVPADTVMEVAQREHATPYDVKDVELGHHGKECSFDAFIKKYGLADDPRHREPPPQVSIAASDADLSRALIVLRIPGINLSPRRRVSLER